MTEPLKASELSKGTVCGHLRLDPDYVDDTEWSYIEALVRSAIAYVCDHCAVAPKYVDDHEDLAIAVLILACDMYDERGMYVDSAHHNRTVGTILSHHDRNLIGKTGEVDDASG